MNQSPSISVFFALAFSVVGLGRSLASRPLPDGLVRFETGSAVLTPKGKATLDRVAAFLKKNQGEQIFLIGHTDDRGSLRKNVRLSKERAMRVKRALVERGLSPARIKVEGAGSAEPLYKETSAKSRGLNRRVEIWIGTKEALAEISWIHEEVLSKKAARQRWQKAQLREPLRRLARVRTGEGSASQVTFKSNDRITLGPQSLVVIHGHQHNRAQHAPMSISQVSVKSGTLFARLENESKSAIEVAAGTGRIKLQSKSARVTRNKRKQMSTISVFDGKAEVSSVGRSVKVPKGYGTRVQRGRAPAPPRPLLFAPKWSSGGAVLGFARETHHIGWIPPKGAKQVEVHLAAFGDEKLDSPVTILRVNPSDGMRLRSVGGLYQLGLASVDDREIPGPVGAPRPLLILERPTDEQGQRIPLFKGRLQAPGPGMLKFTVPKDVELKFATRSTATRSVVTRSIVTRSNVTRSNTVPLYTLGRSTLQLTANDVRFELQVEVSTPTVSLEAIWQGQQRSRGRFRVHDQLGRPSTLAFETYDARNCKLEPIYGELHRGTCEGPSLAKVKRVSGAYLIEGQGEVVAYDARAGLAVRMHLPEVSRPSAPAAPRASWADLVTGVRVGGVLAQVAGVSGHADMGVRLRALRQLSFDLGLDVGWWKRTDEGETTDLIPLGARGAIVWMPGDLRVYLGGMGGVRLEPGYAPRPAWTAFLGLAWSFGFAELGAELGYASVWGSDRIEAGLSGPTVALAWRFTTGGDR